MDPKSLFSLNDHLEMLSRHGDPLEMLERTVDFEYFRAWLVEGLGYGDGSKGGRPPFDPVAMFKIVILQAQHNLSDARMEYMIRDRLSWMRFLGFAFGDRTPDENTIRHFRNRMTETGTLKRVMKAFDWQLHKKGYIPMSGQIIDASLVPAPKQRNTDDERQAIKDGKSAQDIWPDDPAKAAQKDTDARQQQRGLGRHCIPLQNERNMAGRSHADQSHPPAKTQRKVHAQGHRPRQCRKVGDPG